MKKLIIPVILIFLFCTVRIHAQNAQINPVAGLNQQNTSVVNNNFQYVQTGINGIFGLLSQYFTGGILNTINGGTGQNSINWTAGDLVYMSATGVWNHASASTFGPVYTSGSYLVGQNLELSSTGAGSYVKVLEMRLPYGGTLSTTIGVAGSGSVGATAFARIYRNGVAVGTERSVGDSGNSWADFSEDISGWTAGDLIQVYAKINDNRSIVIGGGLRLYSGSGSGVIAINDAVTSYKLQRNWVIGLQTASTPSSLGLNTLGNIGDTLRYQGDGTTHTKTAATTWS